MVVHAEPEVLAQAVAARLIVRLVDAQAARGAASVVLTGGPGRRRGATAAVRDSPARDAVDWSRVDVWWGDERFLPAGHPDRNETQARAALLDALPLDPARVHADAGHGRAGRRPIRRPRPPGTPRNWPAPPSRARPTCRTSTC